jgi:VanZ family protein
MKFPAFYFNKRFLGIFSITWAIIIATISSIPNLPNPEIPESNWISFRLDYLFHFFVFFILGIAVVLWQTPGKLKLARWSMAIIILAGSAFGIIDEVHQLIIPGRSYNPLDLIYNLFGYWAGVLLTYHYFIRNLIAKKGRFSEIKKNLTERV